MIEIIEKANQLKLDKASNGIKRAIITKQKNKKLVFRSISKSNIGDCIEGLDIVGYMKPADEVVSDYYDVLQTDGRVKISIGEVTGHGLESGILMLMHLHSDRIIFVIYNSINYQQFKVFQSYINTLLTSNLDDLCISQLEKNIDEEPSCSGLGLLTIFNDYTTKLGWKFEDCQDNLHQVIVTTMVQLIV